MRNADTAMYAAKAAGKGRTEVFRATMHMEVQRRLQLSGDLRRALDNGELHVQYQPLVDLPSGRVLGAEALARWNHPKLGQVPPVDFIPVAEETGADRAAGRLGAGRGVPPGHALARRQRLRPDLRQRERVAAPVPPAGHGGRAGAGRRWTAAASTRRSWCWRSPSRC